MENNSELLEKLLERVTEYGKTTLELVKLKALDKTTEVISSLVPHSVVFVFIATFIFFINIGIAFWLGDILGTVYYGFFAVAAFYLITGLFVRFFMYKSLKRHIGNYFIKQVLK